MPLDYHSLLTAFFLSGSGLAITFFISWIVSRTERFLIAWKLGVSCMALGALVYGWYGNTMSPVLGAAGFTVVLTGLALVLGAGRAFLTGVLPWRGVCIISVTSSAATAIPILAGYNGAGTVVFNIAAAVILLVTALDYWRGRAEARLAITLLTALYILSGLSFVPCAILLLNAGEWQLDEIPSNWAENLNIGICLITLAGIGALSVALNQARVARGHKRDAETDPLTGLLNRRALLSHIANDIEGPAALVIFDLDHFKMINDVHGHPAGDEVLRTFGKILMSSAPPQGLAARLGGEEFALLLPGASSDAAALLADGVRTRLGERHFNGNGRPFTSTVSAGVACSEDAATNFETLIRDADNALYAAKRNGRNRVAVNSGESEFQAHSRSFRDGQRGPVDLARLKIG